MEKLKQVKENDEVENLLDFDEFDCLHLSDDEKGRNTNDDFALKSNIPEVMKMIDMLRMSYIEGMHFDDNAQVHDNDTIVEDDEEYDDWEKVSVSSLIPLEQKIAEPNFKFNFIEEYS